MLPRSAWKWERIRVALSITPAMFSRPWQILILSTAVSIAGKVLMIFSTGVPTS